MPIPEFILRKLFVRDSLKTHADGFSFALLNTFAPGSFDVAYRHELNIRFLQEAAKHVAAAIANTNGTEHDPLAGRSAAFAEDSTWDDLRGQAQRPGLQGGAQETPSGERYRGGRSLGIRAVVGNDFGFHAYRFQ